MVVQPIRRRPIVGVAIIPTFAGRTGRGTVRLGVPLQNVEIPGELGGQLQVVSATSSVDDCLLVSLGTRSGLTVDRVRAVGGACAAALGSRRITHATIDLDDVLSFGGTESASAFCEGLCLGAFRFDDYLSAKANLPDTRVALATQAPTADLRRAVRRAAVIAEAANLARRLGHEPANLLTPAWLAVRAQALARAHQLSCRVLHEKQLAQAKMRGLLAVGAGSVNPPRLIVLEYGSAKRAKPIVLIGKAVTFDTGGYSLKDKQSLVGMKYDKCGGTAVLGVMQAVARLRLSTPVVGIIGATENMISGAAFRPNDIITAMSGKTVEVISTDAEGRLVLADALTYAQKHYAPRAIIDLATLTGGVTVALGKVRAGLFSNDDVLRTALMAAGDRTHERLWPMPLDDDYLELIKGDDSDLKNSGNREAHPVQGAIFLKQFVDPHIPWAHLDIAGVAVVEKDQPYCPKGATGFGVRLLCDYLQNL